MNQETEQRFWSFVEIEDGGARESGGCWLWRGRKVSHGYGWMTIRNKRGWEMAHRLAWILFRGPIPAGKWVLHHCDVRHCCNPDHLYIGDTRDNTRDRHERGRDCRGRRHHNAHVTEADVLFIRRSRGVIRRVDLAKKYKMSPQAVTLIWQRKNWRHVPEAAS